MVEPVWFKHLDPVFCETKEEMKVTCSAMGTSFSNEQGRGYEQEQNDEQDIFSGADDMGEKWNRNRQRINYWERHFKG